MTVRSSKGATAATTRSTPRACRWTEALPPDHRRWLEERASRQAEFFGYARDEPLAVRPLAAAGGGVVLGSELDARVDAFPDLDLRTRPKPPIYDVAYDPREVVLLTREPFETLNRARGIRALGIRLVRLFPPARPPGGGEAGPGHALRARPAQAAAQDLT